MSVEYLVELEHIKKSFGGTQALKDVSFNLKPGEIHALVGENGAGKSTLMKILSGAHSQTAGTIRFSGKEFSKLTPAKSKELGVSIIYQELVLAPHLTVAENMYLDRLSSGKGFVNRKKLFENANAQIRKIGFNFDSRTLTGNLSVAYQQIVEIARALSRNAKILILDEPTAVLSPTDADVLLGILESLKAEGVGIIYISHRLEEVLQIADRITVLKDGNVIETFRAHGTTKETLISKMIGRNMEGMFPPYQDYALEQEVLRVENLCSGTMVKNVSFALKRGEVLGIAGLVGSGRSETVRALFGADRADSGDIFIEGKRVEIKNVRQAIAHNIGLVPENRKEQGVILPMSLRTNMTMATIGKVTNKLGIFKWKFEKSVAAGLIETLKIKTVSAEMPVNSLSGGNQQKVVLAKWFNADCKIVILDEPTRGVDVGAKYEIYNLIQELAAQGIGVIMISSELIEIIGMCNRTLIMNGGEVKGELSRENMSEEAIMKIALS